MASGYMCLFLVAGLLAALTNGQEPGSTVIQAQIAVDLEPVARNVLVSGAASIPDGITNVDFSSIPTTNSGANRVLIWSADPAAFWNMLEREMMNKKDASTTPPSVVVTDPSTTPSASGTTASPGAGTASETPSSPSTTPPAAGTSASQTATSTVSPATTTTAAAATTTSSTGQGTVIIYVPGSRLAQDEVRRLMKLEGYNSSFTEQVLKRWPETTPDDFMKAQAKVENMTRASQPQTPTQTQPQTPTQTQPQTPTQTQPQTPTQTQPQTPTQTQTQPQTPTQTQTQTQPQGPSTSQQQTGYPYQQPTNGYPYYNPQTGKYENTGYPSYQGGQYPPYNYNQQTGKYGGQGTGESSWSKYNNPQAPSNTWPSSGQSGWPQSTGGQTNTQRTWPSQYNPTGQTSQAGPSYRTGQTPQTGPSYRTGQTPQTGPSYGTGQTSQTGPSYGTGQTPQTGPSYRTGQTPQTGPSYRTGQTSQTGQGTWPSSYNPTGQTSQTSQSGSSGQTSQSGQRSQTGQTSGSSNQNTWFQNNWPAYNSAQKTGYTPPRGIMAPTSGTPAGVDPSKIRYFGQPTTAPQTGTQTGRGFPTAKPNPFQAFQNFQNTQQFQPRVPPTGITNTRQRPRTNASQNQSKRQVGMRVLSALTMGELNPQMIYLSLPKSMRNSPLAQSLLANPDGIAELAESPLGAASIMSML